MLKRRINQAGDTLIEVLFAISIFATVMLGTFLIMNQGISSAQNALEINLVRNQIDTQAELLRHLNNAKLNSIGRAPTEMSRYWDAAVANATRAVDGAVNYGAIQSFDQCSPTIATEAGGSMPNSAIPGNAFFVNPNTGKPIVARGTEASSLQPVQTFAQIQPNPISGDPYDSEGMVSNMIWIEAVESANDHSLPLTKYYDFHIRACWDSSGPSGGLMKLGTIVRLYVPKQ